MGRIMYELIKFVGFFIRQFLLPNPFVAMWPEKAFLINLIAGAILVPVAYFITGLWYRRGDGAAWGSFLFNVVYIVLSLALWGIIELIKIITDNWIVTVVIASVMLLIATAVALVIRYAKKKAGKQAG